MNPAMLCAVVKAAERGVTDAAKLGACEGELDDYCCSDGSLICLCEKHLPGCRFVMHDDGTPMSKKYYDEVYKPRLDNDKMVP